MNDVVLVLLLLKMDKVAVEYSGWSLLDSKSLSRQLGLDTCLLYESYELILCGNSLEDLLD